MMRHASWIGGPRDNHHQLRAFFLAGIFPAIDR